MDVAQEPRVLKRVARAPYAEVEGFSALFVDYVSQAPGLKEYYRLGWGKKDLLQAASDAARAPHADRERVVSILERQQTLWGDDRTASANVRRLRDPGASVVITGQQVGLFTGPLYTVLKALTTVLLARELEEAHGPVIPVFWLGTEDHDLAEMASTWIPGRPDPVELRYTAGLDPEADNSGPVGALTLGDDFQDVLARLEAQLPGTDFLPAVMTMVREAYRPGASFRDAFARLLRALLPDSGLVLFAPDDPEVKDLSAPLIRREIQDWKQSDRALREASSRIAKTHFAQVHIRPSNLFLLRDGTRLPLDVINDRFVARGTESSWSSEELLALLDAHPEQFSPNVVMRPLTQDWLFPTAAYVAGPGETAYFAQYRKVYEWAGIPMPVIYPRVSASFIEPGIRRSLDKLELAETSFGDDPDALFSRLARDRMELDVEARFGGITKQIDRLMDELSPEVVAVDGSLDKTVEATRAALHKELDRLGDRVLKADRRNQDQLRQQIQKVSDALFPMGKLQERVINPLYFVSKYGPDFFSGLLQSLDADTREHLLLDL